MPAKRSIISILQLVSRSLYWWTLVTLSRCQFTLELVKVTLRTWSLLMELAPRL